VIPSLDLTPEQRQEIVDQSKASLETMQEGFSGIVDDVAPEEPKDSGALAWAVSTFEEVNSISKANQLVELNVAAQQFPDKEPENLYETLKPYMGQIDRFQGATTIKEIEYIKSKIDREEYNHKIMSEHGFFANLAMSTPALDSKSLYHWSLSGTAYCPRSLSR